MGFAYGVAIVTASQVASILHEMEFANLDSPTDSATEANLLPEATNEIWRCLKKWRGVDPSKVSNTTEFQKAAALYVAYRIYASRDQTDEQNRTKTAAYKKEYEEEVKSIEVETTDAVNSVMASKGLPTALNLDYEPYVNRPTFNRRPFPRLSPPFKPMPGQGP